MERELEKKKDDEPLILEVITVANLAVEVGQVLVLVRGADAAGGGGGDGESERFMLPYVIGGIWAKIVEDLEVERLELRGKLTAAAGAGGGFGIFGSGEDAEVGINGEEDSIIGNSGVLLREDGGRRLGAAIFLHCRP